MPFIFNWDASGQDGNDMYFHVEKDDQIYEFKISAALSGKDPVYEKAKALGIGDIIDVEGFFYWSEDEGPFPTITEIQLRLQ